MVHVHSIQARFLGFTRYPLLVSLPRTFPIEIGYRLMGSFRGTPEEPEIAFDETAKAIAMNGVSPVLLTQLTKVLIVDRGRNALLSGCSVWKIYRRT